MDTDNDRVGPHPTGDGLDPARGRAWSSFTDSPTGTRVLRAGATLDMTAAAALRREATGLLARSVRSLVVDLSDVRLADPDAASAVLRELAYEAGDADVDLRVVTPEAPEVTRAVLGDETLFEIFPTVDAALQRATGRTASPRDSVPVTLPPPGRDEAVREPQPRHPEID